MTSDRIAVCELQELPPGERLLIEVRDTKLCLFNVEGDCLALGATCVHRGGPICKGERNDETIACPWHGWEYDLTTGAHLGAADASLPTVPVTVENGTVYLDASSVD
jgi:nitrite reductase/ring-hydroxylating ferredoxin subunit